MSAESDMQDHRAELDHLIRIWQALQDTIILAYRNHSFTECQRQALTDVQQRLFAAIAHCNPYLMTGCECDAAKRGDLNVDE